VAGALDYHRLREGRPDDARNGSGRLAALGRRLRKPIRRDPVNPLQESHG